MIDSKNFLCYRNDCRYLTTINDQRNYNESSKIYILIAVEKFSFVANCSQLIKAPFERYDPIRVNLDFVHEFFQSLCKRSDDNIRLTVALSAIKLG